MLKRSLQTWKQDQAQPKITNFFHKIPVAPVSSKRKEEVSEIDRIDSSESPTASEIDTDFELWASRQAENLQHKRLKPRNDRNLVTIDTSLFPENINPLINLSDEQDKVLQRDDAEQFSQETNNSIFECSPPEKQSTWTRLRHKQSNEEQTQQKELAEEESNDSAENSDKNDEQLLASDSEGEISNPNKQFLDELGSEDEPDAAQLKQIQQNGWLERVTEALRPLSVQKDYSDNLGLQFKQLKKQWGYTGYYKQVNSNDTDCSLCGHEHVATLFKIWNFFTQKKMKAGSSCIKQFRVLNETGDGLLGKEESKKMIEKDIKDSNDDRAAHRRELNSYIL